MRTLQNRFTRSMGTAAALTLSIALPGIASAWTTAIPLNGNARGDSGHDFNPDLAPTGSGSWVAVWQTNERSLSNAPTASHGIAVARSGDNGATWSAPTPLHANARGSEGDMWQPRVAADSAGRCVAIWTRLISPDLQLGQVLVSRSSDYGVTWTNPAPIRSDEPSADLRTQITTDGNGLWIAIWATSNGVRFSRSTDNGANWSNPQTLSSSGNRGGLPDLETDGKGVWIATWTASVADNDVAAVRSTDHGLTWQSLGYLNSNANGDGSHEWLSQLATDRKGNWVAVWQNYNSSGLAVSRSSDNGASWSGPSQVFTTFTSEKQPALDTDGSGNWIVIWERVVSTSRFDVMTATSTDNGANWSQASALLTDSNASIQPVLEANRYGKWLTAVYDDNVPDNVSGTDYDLLVSGHDLAMTPRSRLANRQFLRVTTFGTGYQELFYNYSNNALSVSPYSAVSGAVAYPLPTDSWIGIYHYDYATGRFSQAVYQTKDPL